MIPDVHTIDAVAARLGKSRRWLMGFARQRGIGGRAGRTRLFTDEDIAQIILEIAAVRRPSQYVIDASALLPIAQCHADKFGVVYFIEAGDFIKIGHSRNWQNRLLTIRTSSPLPLSVLHISPGGKDKERALHRKFHHCHSHGEWFRKTADLLAYIDMLKRDRV